jgi:hypothetical protein
MDRGRLLVVLTTTGSALCWWPVIMQPNLDFPFWWLPLTLVALVAGLSTVLSDGVWLRFVVAASVGTFVGVFGGFLVWWPTDRIDASFVPVVVISAVLASVAVSLVASLALRRVTLSNHKRRRALWIGLICCVVFGPFVVPLTPPLVALRVASNDRIAERRILCLHDAAVQTMADSADPDRLCDGSVLRRHYSGPAFSEKDWRYIAGNYVKRDGYLFSIYCHEKAGYAIDARPDRERGDGTRKFCADESGAVGCGMKWTGSRHECLPCTK